MNTTTYDRSVNYNFISQQLTKYAGSFLYSACLLGTLMNIFTFVQPKYTRRACSLYLLTASICDLIHLNIGPLSNILQYGFHHDGIIRTLAYCRSKNYLVYALMIISGTLTALASINQFMLTSTKSARWQFTCRSAGIRNIKLTILFWTIFSTAIVFCSTRRYHASNNEQLICSNSCQYLSCRLVQFIYVCWLNGFFPPIIMMIFGFLASANVRRLRQRSASKSRLTRQINEQLTSMLILQSLKSMIASVPYAIFNCYWIRAVNQHRSLEDQALENLIHQTIYVLFWSNYTSFFMYIYASNIFRHQWIKTMKKLICSFRREQRRTSL